MLPKLLRWLISNLLFAAVFFLPAGRIDLPMFWAYFAIASLAALYAILNVDPSLFKERKRPGPGGRDRLPNYVGGPMVLVHFIVASLDVGRFHWSDTVPVFIQIPALVLVGGALSLMMWSMVINRYFSSVIRIQKDRGHQVVTAGPYQYVRHPGYAAMMVWGVSSGPALGSWWSIVPISVYTLLVLRRAILEDRILPKELEGYAGYAKQVRFRFIPGVW